jgi:enoyl-CoA hydratase/carnithine racemase
MTTLSLTTQGNVLRIQLDRGTANPIDRAMVAALRAALQQLQDGPDLQGGLLIGKPGFFSAGLDVLALHAYDEAEMAAFWGEFSALIYELAACPKPLVAAISGHSPAGGCVLALCCDARLMAEGSYKIGLNEVPVGIVVPESIYHLYAQTVGQRQAYQFLMAGKMLTPTEALAAGLVDQVVPLDGLEAAANAQNRPNTADILSKCSKDVIPLFSNLYILDKEILVLSANSLCEMPLCFRKTLQRLAKSSII